MRILKFRHIIFKLGLVLAFAFFLNQSQSIAQENTHKDTSRCSMLIPDYIKLQYAGGIGFMSAGVGYTFFKERLDVTMFYGYVPKTFGITDLQSISLQLTVKLLKYKINDNIEILPLNFGWYAHHTFGSEFWVTLPDKYSKGYYWWSPGRNAGIFIGGELKTKLLANESPASGTAFYFRIGSRGLYIASKAGNSTIPLTDIIELGFGVAIYR
jgi:hypothetical protein